MDSRDAKFSIGDVVKHRLFPFRGVIFDVDPVFNNTDEWYESIPADLRPRKDQPFYHLLAENAPLQKLINAKTEEKQPHHRKLKL